MDEYQSGLESLFARAVEGGVKDSGSPDVILSEKRHVTITQVSFFSSEQAKMTKFLSSLGLANLPSYSQLKSAKSVSVARVEMEKLWLIGTLPKTEIDASFYPLDLSSARNIIRLSGNRADDVMARLCAVDFRDNTRNFFATSIHHVAVHVHKSKDAYEIYIPRSFAESIAEYILDISKQYHVQKA